MKTVPAPSPLRAYARLVALSTVAETTVEQRIEMRRLARYLTDLAMDAWSAERAA